MGGKSSTEARQPTDIELQYLETQDKSLKQAMDMFIKEANLGDEDRRYFEDIYRGGVDPDSPEVRQEVARRIEAGKADFDKYDGERISKKEYVEREYNNSLTDNGFGQSYTKSKEQVEAEYDRMLESGEISDVLSYDDSGVLEKVLTDMQDTSKGIDSILFNSAKGSDSGLELALGNYSSSMQKYNKEFGKDISGLSKDMISNINNYSKDYENKLSNIANEYKTDSQAAINKYGDLGKEALSQYEKSSGIAEGKIGELYNKYASEAKGISSRMGQADQDIESITRGRELAGISSAYKESQDELLSVMSRRGLEGSGVEAGALSQLGRGQAQDKASAYSRGYTQAVGASDTRRMQQLGIAGDVYQQGVNSAMSGLGVSQGVYGAQTQYNQGLYGAESSQAGNIANMSMQAQQGIYSSGMTAGQTAYGANMSNVNSMYGVNSQLQGQMYTGGVQNTQQYLSNLNMAAGASQGVYGGAQNFMNMSGSGFNQSAQIAGSQASSLANSQLQFNQMQNQANQSTLTGIGSLLGTGIGAYAGTRG